MTPEEKAKELIEKFTYLKGKSKGCPDPIFTLRYYQAKLSTLISVQEMIDELSCINDLYDGDFKSYTEYWKEVKQEIKKFKYLDL